MLRDYLSIYLESVEGEVKKLQGVYVERYEEEILAGNRINVRIRIRFQSDHMLEINEAVIGERNQIVHLGYRYHFQNGANNLIFRYENTPHFPELATYPHHKHVLDDVKAVKQPSIFEVIDEAKYSVAGS
jgi:hypothetical protein